MPNYNLIHTGAEVDDAVTRSKLRAFANINGTGVVAIRSSYNVSSITDINTGRYGVNLTTALEDGNGVVTLVGSIDGTATNFGYPGAMMYSNSQARITFYSTTYADTLHMNTSIFR